MPVYIKTKPIIEVRSKRRLISYLFALTSFLIIFITVIASCNSVPDKTDHKVYYYSFSGFDTTEVTAKLLADFTEILQQNDYMINENNLYISVPRDSVLSPESFDYLHPFAHRIEIISPATKFKPGDRLIEVINKSTSPDQPVMLFIRYKYSSENKWVPELNTGDHVFMAYQGGIITIL